MDGLTGQSCRRCKSGSLNEVIYAPVEQGQQVGLVSITLDGTPLKEVPLIALESVDTGSVFSRMFDTIHLWFN